MPYLRLTCAALSVEQRITIAQQLTKTVVELFYQPQARLTREELKERTTVHFLPYADNELFIGGETPATRQCVDLTLELSDWYMSVRQQRKVAQQLTPVLAELFAVPVEQTDGINIRFHSYAPTDFAVGGRLLADLVPRLGQLAKRLFN